MGQINANEQQVNRSTSENAKTVSELRRALPQFVAVSVKNILLFGYGLTLGFPTIIIPAIQGGAGKEAGHISLNREQISWFSSINLICVPLGSIISGPITQPLGKKVAMQIVNIPILLSWLLFHFSTNVYFLYASLCLSGLSGGLMEAPVLTYVSEITDPKYRGILAASGSTCVIMGVFIQFVLGSLLDWRTIAAVCTVFPVLSIVSLFFIPESPYWLMRNNRLEEAIKSLAWLRGWVPKHYIEQEFDQLYDDLITSQAAKDKTGTNCCERISRPYRTRSFWIPFALVSFTFVVDHFSGKTTLQTYAVQIFHTLKAPIDKYHATVLLGLAELIGTMLCVVLIHFTGKRKLVLISTTGVCLCFFGTATYAHYLNTLTGFGVANVVTNASKTMPHENNEVITSKNLSEIFENEEKILKMNQNCSLHMMCTIDDSFDNSSIYSESSYETISTQRYYNDSDIGDMYVTLFNDYDFSSQRTEAPISDENVTIFVHHKNETTESSISTNVTFNSNSEITENILIPIPKQKVNVYLWIPLLLLLASACFSHLGIRLIPWILIGEVFPSSIRSTASGVSGGVGYMFGFLANKFFLQMVSAMTLPGVFWFNSSVSLIGTVVLYFILPETEGKSLMEIENYFAGSKSKNNADESATRTPSEVPESREIPLEVINSKAIGLKRVRNCSSLPNKIGIVNQSFVNVDEDIRENSTQL